MLDVELAGICGSDLHGYRGHPGPRVPPLVLGHEVVGRVDGEPYAVYPLIGCGECAHCLAGEDNLCATWRLIGMHRPGVFAERVAVPRRSLVPLPDGIDPERAVLVEPLACCVGALAPHGDARSVAVLGCGPLGLLTVFLAARSGATVTAVDPLSERRAIAERLGAATTADELEPGDFDLAVDAAGFEATWRAGLSFATRVFPCGHFQAASAWVRSATRSSGCSTPIDSLIVDSRTPIRSRTSLGTPEWVMAAGWLASDSVPPRLTASFNI